MARGELASMLFAIVALVGLMARQLIEEHRASRGDTGRYGRTHRRSSHKPIEGAQAVDGYLTCRIKELMSVGCQTILLGALTH